MCFIGIILFSTLFGIIPTHFASVFYPLCGQELTLEVDRISEHPDASVQFDRFDETDYEAVENATPYQVSFSVDMKTVSIMPGSVTGVLVENTEDYMAYDLNDGLFAGGRFTVWISDGLFAGEYTIHGSGVPIISSERGPLVFSEEAVQ